MAKITISPDQIQEGDQMVGEDGLVAWVALDDADPIGINVYCPIRWADGARDVRVWHTSVPVEFTVIRA